MEVSKSYTQDTFSSEGMRKYKAGYEEVFKKKKSVKKMNKRTEREKVREELNSMWLEYINGRGSEGTFSDYIIDYILSKEFYKKLDRIHSRRNKL